MSTDDGPGQERPDLLTMVSVANLASRAEFRLEDRFAATLGEVVLTGVQAVCRIPLDVRRIDERHGLSTRGFVTGYQGSPLGTVDFAMRPMRDLLKSHGVDFQPGMNEMLAATAVQGTQSVSDIGSPLRGVTGYWYGKSPGVDQALDAIRHGNLMGTSPFGGVLAFCGDDAAAKSSTVPGGSETVLRAALVPTLAAADPNDVLSLGLHAVAMSRASGIWTALKVATNVADAYGVATLGIESFQPVIPVVDDKPYLHSVNTMLAAASAVAAEQNLHEVRLPLVLQYARLNQLNTITACGATDTMGIVAAGQAYAEVRQSLADMGLRSADALARAGIRLLKIGLVWPLDPEIVNEFASGLEHIVVVEEKGPHLELLVKDVLFNRANRATVLGQTDRDGRPLLPAFGGVDADAITKAIAPMILARGDNPGVSARLERLAAPVRIPLSLTVATRTPYFCSGCPHNTSTKIPDGSLVGNGIGCHTMTMMMDPDHSGTVTGLTQMGGEGAQWIGQQPYVYANHLFQNLGDGTLAHSGLLAIRASVAAGINITYKILYNSAVAMTGGQDAVGGYTVAQLTETLAAEGVRRIYVTTDHPENYRRIKLAKVATVRDRIELSAIQEDLRKIPGTTVLIHDQPCAAELRRKRKRGKAPTPEKRIVINERICEGCGDCGRKSNCLSVIPADTEFGRKTQIHQPSCNSDFSCLQGDCPSFMEVVPGTNANRTPAPSLALGDMPSPQTLFDADGFSVRITGIGGTGIVTVAQVLATAGFLDGYHPCGLDQIGLSQKAGPVISDLKLRRAHLPASPKINTQNCDLYLCCDPLVGSEAGSLAVTRPGHTVAVVTTADVPTGAMIRKPETALTDLGPLIDRIDNRTRRAHNRYVDARRLSEALFGSDQFANMLLVGVAFQSGGLPLSDTAIERAIALNGVAVEANTQAFRYGRLAVVDPHGVLSVIAPQTPVTEPAPPSAVAAELIAGIDLSASSDLARSVCRRVPDLIDYQNVSYARRYAELVSSAQKAEQRCMPGASTFALAVADNLYKLMAYKDEYEVARLALDPDERAKLAAQFGDDAKVVWKLFPPVLREMGLKRKLSLGRWFTVFYVLLRWAKWLRGTPFDLFGYTTVRKIERSLVGEYAHVIQRLTAELTADNHALATRIAQLPDVIRGYEQVKLGNVERYHRALAELSEQFKGQSRIHRPAK